MKCKKCGSDLISFGFKESSEKSVKRKTSFFYALLRSFLIFCTCGLWLLVPRKKDTTRTKIKQQKYAICKNCGYSWNIK